MFAASSELASVIEFSFMLRDVATDVLRNRLTREVFFTITELHQVNIYKLHHCSSLVFRNASRYQFAVQRAKRIRKSRGNVLNIAGGALARSRTRSKDIFRTTPTIAGGHITHLRHSADYE